MGFDGNLNGNLMRLNENLNESNRNVMGFNGISWDLMRI